MVRGAVEARGRSSWVTGPSEAGRVPISMPSAMMMASRLGSGR